MIRKQYIVITIICAITLFIFFNGNSSESRYRSIIEKEVARQMGSSTVDKVQDSINTIAHGLAEDATKHNRVYTDDEVRKLAAEIVSSCR